jgi:hypothetical protein
MSGKVSLLPKDFGSLTRGLPPAYTPLFIVGPAQEHLLEVRVAAGPSLLRVTTRQAMYAPARSQMTPTAASSRLPRGPPRSAAKETTAATATQATNPPSAATVSMTEGDAAAGPGDGAWKARSDQSRGDATFIKSG